MEAIPEVKASKYSLVLATLDTEKAFDVVSHPILFLCLYNKRGFAADMHLACSEGHVRGLQWKSMLEKHIQEKLHNGSGDCTRKDSVSTCIRDLHRQPPTKPWRLRTGRRWDTTFIESHTYTDDVLLISPRFSDMQSLLNIHTLENGGTLCTHQEWSLLLCWSRSNTRRRQTTIHKQWYPFRNHQRPQEWLPDSTDKYRLCKMLCLLTDHDWPSWRC